MKYLLLVLCWCASAHAEQVDVSRATAIAGQNSSGAKELFTSTTNALNVDLGARLSAHNSNLGALETSNGGTATRVTTIASQQIYVGASMVKRIIVATTTVGTFVIYDDADGTCSSTQKTGTITPAAGTVWELGIEVSAGLCILTGGTAIDMTVVYLP